MELLKGLGKQEAGRYVGSVEAERRHQVWRLWDPQTTVTGESRAGRQVVKEAKGVLDFSLSGCCMYTPFCLQLHSSFISTSLEWVTSGENKENEASSDRTEQRAEDSCRGEKELKQLSEAKTQNRRWKKPWGVHRNLGKVTGFSIGHGIKAPSQFYLNLQRKFDLSRHLNTL